VHWVIAGMPPNLASLSAGNVPSGLLQAQNDGGTPGWTGPCPLPGSGVHQYVFTVYALAEPSRVTAGTRGDDAVARLEDLAVTARATLTGTYQRG
jgi:phosphatidylethanolamine-binding protein (PEBP) family uncharacterized protein